MNVIAQVKQKFRLLSSIVKKTVNMRLDGYRFICMPAQMPRCSEKNLKKSECMRRKQLKTPDHLLVKDPKCGLCPASCKGMLPRFDDLYYEISNKGKRKYARTWIECPASNLKPTRCCCLKNLKLPPLPGRKKIVCPCPAKRICGADRHLMKCFRKTLCPTIKMPCGNFCRRGRRPPRCVKAREVRNCKKVPAPCPAFSELNLCYSPKPGRAECKCLDSESWCGIAVRPAMKLEC